MALFLVFWISPAVNSTKSFKYLAEKGYCCFLELFAMLFMQLQGSFYPLHIGAGAGVDLDLIANVYEDRHRHDCPGL